jgi:hypothetical protein
MEYVVIDPIKRANQIAQYVLAAVVVINVLVLAWKVL